MTDTTPADQVAEFELRGTAAIRADMLTEAADFLRDAHFRDGMSVQEIGTAMRHWADRERRTTAEVPQPEAHPPTVTWKVESPRRDSWASWGATYDEHDWARERYESATSTAPARPFRLVRATTMYTVEAEHTPPAPVVQQPSAADTAEEAPR